MVLEYDTDIIPLFAFRRADPCCAGAQDRKSSIKRARYSLGETVKLLFEESDEESDFSKSANDSVDEFVPAVNVSSSDEDHISENSSGEDD